MKTERFNLSQTAWVTSYVRENPREDGKPMPAVIICPGGGYEHVSRRESEPLALAFLSQGYQAFVLDYTVSSKLSDYGTSRKNFLADCLAELKATFLLVQSHAKDWAINPEKVFLLGLSAGGHLASWYATSWQEIGGPRPAGLLLSYAVTDFRLGWPASLDFFKFDLGQVADYASHEKVNSQTPETFIWHTVADDGVPVINSLRFCEALAAAGISFEAHLFENGPHGLSLATRSSAPSNFELEPDTASWFPLAIRFLERRIN
ncbi:MAG: alpha/beta hydrolase [Streptococcaceae bacterium]|jgi:acetyl esterase/lipase|nr:alpha/beta hydrolase [Streptococcaceae bacterium]